MLDRKKLLRNWRNIVGHLRKMRKIVTGYLSVVASPKDDLDRVAMTANILDTSEHEVFLKAARRWNFDDRTADADFINYINRDYVPFYVRHYTREVCND